MARHSTVNAPGRVVPGQLLTVERAQADLGLAYLGWKRLRDAGLEAHIKQIAGKSFILSDDLIQCFARMPGRGAK